MPLSENYTLSPKLCYLDFKENKDDQQLSGHAKYRQSSVVGSGENRKRVPCGVQASGKRCNIYAITSEIGLITLNAIFG